MSSGRLATYSLVPVGSNPEHSEFFGLGSCKAKFLLCTRCVLLVAAQCTCVCRVSFADQCSPYASPLACLQHKRQTQGQHVTVQSTCTTPTTRRSRCARASTEPDSLTAREGKQLIKLLVREGAPPPKHVHFQQLGLDEQPQQTTE